MYKFIIALLPFVKELFFDRKEEMEFTNYLFNIKKWIIYVLFLTCVVLLITAIGRLLSITSQYIEISKRYHKLEVVEKNDLDMIITLKEKNKNMQDENNELRLECTEVHAPPPTIKPSRLGDKVKKSEPSK